MYYVCTIFVHNPIFHKNTFDALQLHQSRIAFARGANRGIEVRENETRKFIHGENVGLENSQNSRKSAARLLWTRACIVRVLRSDSILVPIQSSGRFVHRSWSKLGITKWEANAHIQRGKHMLMNRWRSRRRRKHVAQNSSTSFTRLPIEKQASLCCRRLSSG